MGPTRVLLVDDEEDFTDILSARMETRGLLVDVSPNGIDALEKADRTSYDAVILDLAMPGMDGIQTLKRLLAKNPDIQVILLTGYATLEKGLEAIKSGAMEFLEKPVDIDKLMGIISQARDKTVQLTEKRIEEAINRITRKKGW